MGLRRRTRLGSFLSGLTRTLILVSIIAAVVAFVQAVSHPIDQEVLRKAKGQFSALDRTLSSNLVAGVSLGTVVVVLIVAAVAALGRGVHRRQYAVSFWRGLLSSAIFLLSDTFYRLIQDLGQLYYVASIALFVAITLVLVEILARWGNAAEERERRTEFLASIVSGLCFALVVQVGEAFFSSIPGVFASLLKS